MDAGRKHRTPGSETKDIVTHGIASNMNISIFVLGPLSFKWNFQCDGPRWMLQMQSVRISAEQHWIWGTYLFYSKQ